MVIVGVDTAAGSDLSVGESASDTAALLLLSFTGMTTALVIAAVRPDIGIDSLLMVAVSSIDSLSIIALLILLGSSSLRAEEPTLLLVVAFDACNRWNDACCLSVAAVVVVAVVVLVAPELTLLLLLLLLPPAFSG